MNESKYSKKYNDLTKKRWKLLNLNVKVVAVRIITIGKVKYRGGIQLFKYLR